MTKTTDEMRAEMIADIEMSAQITAAVDAELQNDTLTHFKNECGLILKKMNRLIGFFCSPELENPEIMEQVYADHFEDLSQWTSLPFPFEGEVHAPTFDYETCVLLAFAKSPLTSSDFLEMLINYDRSDIRAGNRPMETEERSYAGDFMMKDFIVRLAIARRDDLTLDVQLLLAKDYSLFIRNLMASYGSVACEVKLTMTNDPSSEIIVELIRSAYKIKDAEQRNNLVNEALKGLSLKTQIDHQEKEDVYYALIDITESLDDLATLNAEQIEQIAAILLEPSNSCINALQSLMLLRNISAETIKKIVFNEKYHNEEYHRCSINFLLPTLKTLDAELKNFIIDKLPNEAVTELMYSPWVDAVSLERIANDSSLDDEVIEMAKNKLANMQNGAE